MAVPPPRRVAMGRGGQYLRYGAETAARCGLRVPVLLAAQTEPHGSVRSGRKSARAAARIGRIGAAAQTLGSSILVRPLTRVTPGSRRAGRVAHLTSRLRPLGYRPGTRPA